MDDQTYFSDTDEAKYSRDPRRLSELATSRDSVVVQCVARNPLTAPGTLEELLWHRSSEVIAALLTNPSLDPGLVMAHLRHAEDRVRNHAGRVTPHVEVLELLMAGSSHDQARCAGNPHLTGPQALVLAASPEEEVRYCLADRRDRLTFPHDHPPGLRGCQDAVVDEAAREQVSLRLSTDSSHHVRAALAQNPGTSEAALANLAGFHDELLHHLLAGRPSLPQDLRPRLHVSALIRWGLLEGLLAREPHREVARALSENWVGTYCELVEAAGTI